MVAAVTYLLVMIAGFIGVFPVLVWLCGESPSETRFQNDYGKKEKHEMLMFSGLETQGEINRLLDELYGGLDQDSPVEAGHCEPHRPKAQANGEPIVEEEINEELGAIEPILVPQSLTVDGF